MTSRDIVTHFHIEFLHTLESTQTKLNDEYVQKVFFDIAVSLRDNQPVRFRQVNFVHAGIIVENLFAIHATYAGSFHIVTVCKVLGNVTLRRRTLCIHN